MFLDKKVKYRKKVVLFFEITKERKVRKHEHFVLHMILLSVTFSPVGDTDIKVAVVSGIGRTR